jgi:hypothetical protein
MEKFAQTDSGLSFGARSFTLHTASSLSPNSEAIAKAHQSFVTHAPAIFGDPSINPETGQTVYADIETRKVWEDVVSGYHSTDKRTHHGVAIAACDAEGKPIGFIFSIYHAASNSMNFVYAGIDKEYRARGLDKILSAKAEEEMTRLAKQRGFEQIAGSFVECCDDAVKLNKFYERGGLGLVPYQWATPLLISDGQGGMNEQHLNLRVKFAPSLSDEMKAETLSEFNRDFYALYTRLYDTPSLGVRSIRENTAHLDGMEKELRANLSAPAQAAGRRDQAQLHTKKL